MSAWSGAVQLLTAHCTAMKATPWQPCSSTQPNASTLMGPAVACYTMSAHPTQPHVQTYIITHLIKASRASLL